MKTKLILSAGVLLMAFASCKKDITCECTTTYTSTNTDSNGTVTTNTQVPSTNKTEYKKVKKSKLGTLCGDKKSTDNSTNTSSNGQTASSSSTSETKCVIK